MESLEKEKKEIWGCFMKDKKFCVRRLSRMAMPLYMFSMNGCGVCSIRNNLRFELLYVENDDQRYSMKSNENLVNDLIIEGAEEPYGSSVFYGGL